MLLLGDEDAVARGPGCILLLCHPRAPLARDILPRLSSWVPPQGTGGVSLQLMAGNATREEYMVQPACARRQPLPGVWPCFSAAVFESGKSCIALSVASVTRLK